MATVQKTFKCFTDGTSYTHDIRSDLTAYVLADISDWQAESNRSDTANLTFERTVTESDWETVTVTVWHFSDDDWESSYILTEREN